MAGWLFLHQTISAVREITTWVVYGKNILKLKTKMRCLWDLWPNVRVRGFRGNENKSCWERAAILAGAKAWYVFVFGKAWCDGFSTVTYYCSAGLEDREVSLSEFFMRITDKK